MLVLFQSLQDFTYIAFKGLLCINCLHSESHHIASKSFETFHTPLNDEVLMIKLGLGHCWFTAEIFLQLTCSSKIDYFLLCAWISEILKYLIKSLETFRKWPIQYSLLKKLSLECAPIMLVVFQSLQDFTDIAFKGLLCINCLHSESHHIASKSFETFHPQPNDEVLMIKLSLGHCWFTEQIFVQLTYSSKINYFLLCAWICESLNYLMKSLETFHKWPIEYSLLKKLSLELAPIMLVLFQSLQDFTYIAFKGLLCINCLHSGSHHMASKSFETFHPQPNDEVWMIKLSLGHCWFTAEMFVDLTCSSKINYFLLCAWICESLKYFMKSLETFHKWSIQYSLLKKLSLELAPIMLVLFQCLQDFTYIAFKGLLCINCLHSEIHHIESKSFETFHTPPNDEVLMIKLSLGHCWVTAEMFLQLTCSSKINYFLLCGWISEIFKYLMKSLETFHKWSIQYSLLKKLSLELAPIMLVLFQSLQDFTYLAFKSLLCINCLDSEIHHIESKSFETFHTPPNDEVLMIKLSLGHCWVTAEIFLQLTCSSKINYFLLCAWISEILKYLIKSLETFRKWPIQYSLLKKLSLECAPIMLVLFRSLQDFTYIAFKGLLCINCLHSEIHHIASKSFETFHTLPNDEVLMIKLSLGHCWFTEQIFVQLTYSSKINYFLLCAWICESLNYLMKSLETFHKWPIEYSLLKKLSLELAPIMLVLFQSLQDFTYIAFKGLLCINCLHSGSHHIASKSFETFHTPPNDEVLMIKLSLGHCWFTAEMFLQLTCSSKINYFLLCAWISEIFKYLMKSLETFHK